MSLLIIGWSVCPPEVANPGNCFSNTSWQNAWKVGTAMRAKSATANSIYSRENTTILSVNSLSISDVADSFALSDFLSTIERVFAADLDPSGQLNFNASS